MTTTISPLPTPPTPADSPVDFNTKAFALLGGLPAFVSEANAQAAGLDASVAAAGAQAAIATNKAGEALTSANNAALSKTGADSARDAAVIAKNSAEAALDSFDDRYLGAKAVAPTADNDGNALLTGALYWDTALPGMRAWSGSVWVTLPAATKASVGLGNVDNTSDASKPVSTATQTALDGKANNSHTHAVADVSGLQAALDGMVKTAGEQSISGLKTFNNSLVLQGDAPTLFLKGTTHLSSMVHVAGNYFYILRGEVNSTTWTMVNGQWPLTIDLTNNNAIFGGNVTASGTVTGSSDIRLKTDLTKIEGALGKVCSLNGYTYTRRDTGERQTGVVAQEVQKVLPEAVVDNGGTLSAAYGNMVGLLIEAIKELKAEVDQLKGK